MGFSNQSNASKTFASMKVLKDENDKSTPFFIIKHKEDGSWVEKQRFTTLTAEPYDIELGSYDYKGSPVDTVTMQMMDGIEKIQLEFNLDSGLSRSLLNTMLGEQHIGTLTMSLYVNKSGYPSIGIENDGQKTSWKYKFEQFPAVTKNKKGAVIDNDEYLEFMRQMVRDIKKKLSSKSGAPAETASEYKSKKAEPAGINEPESDLPF